MKLNKKMFAFVTALSVTPMSWASLTSIPTGIEAGGSIEFNEFDSFADNLEHSSTLEIGTATTEIVNGVVSAGSNPLTVTELLAPITFDIDVDSTAFNADFESVTYDFSIDLANNLSSGSARFLFSYSFSALIEAAVDSFFDDVVVDAEFLIDDQGISEAFSFGFLDFDPDLSGNFDETVAGGFNVLLGAGQNLTFSGQINVLASNFGDATFSSTTSGNVSLDEIQLIPEPASLFLMLAGCAGLAMRRRAK